jgi:hypothetical protein
VPLGRSPETDGEAASAPDVSATAREAAAGRARSTGEPQRGPLAEIAAFLHAARIAAAVVKGERLRVAGIDVQPPPEVLADGESRRRWLDAFVGERFSGQLSESVRRHLPPLRASLQFRADEGLVVLVDRRGRRVAQISATRAVTGQRVVEGNFLVRGDHWAKLGGILDEFVVEAPRIATPNVYRSLPGDINPEWRTAAESASRRLRDDRTLVFAHDVRVDIEEVSLVFSPLTLSPRLEVPFALERGEARFEGALRLTASDVLPCVWRQRTDMETLALSWTLALTAYAELTCVEPQPNEPRAAPGVVRGSRPGRRRSEAPAPRQPGKRTSGATALPIDFRPRGRTLGYLASYVAGHRRRLQPGHEHSRDAERNAAAVGITLRRGETWVQPHVRGVPADAVLHFAWAGPGWARQACTSKA